MDIKSKIIIILEHRNYLGVDERYGPIAISVKLEQSKDNEDHDPRYRAIFRTKEGDLRSVFPVTSVLYSGVRNSISLFIIFMNSQK